MAFALNDWLLQMLMDVVLYQTLVMEMPATISSLIQTLVMDLLATIFSLIIKYYMSLYCHWLHNLFVLTWMHRMLRTLALMPFKMLDLAYRRMVGFVGCATLPASAGSMLLGKKLVLILFLM